MLLYWCLAFNSLVFQVNRLSLCNGAHFMESDTTQLMELLRLAAAQRDFNTLLIMKSDNDTCLELEIAKTLQKPVLLLQNANEELQLVRQFNSEFMAWVCLKANTLESQINKLAQALQHMRHSRLILLLTDDVAPATDLLTQLFRLCYEHHMLNTLVVNKSFFRAGIYYSYQAFPRLQIETHHFKTAEQSSLIYPNRLHDLHGHTIVTLPDQLVPRSLVYRDKSGAPQLIGHLSHFVQTFAHFHNATLVQLRESQPDEQIYYGEFQKLAENNTLDIPMALTPLVSRLNFNHFTYPYEVMTFCTMMPIQPPVKISKMLVRIFGTTLITLILLASLALSLALTLVKRVCYAYSIPLRQTFWYDLFLNDKVLRGILGQSFVMHLKRCNFKIKLLYCLVFFVGILLNALYTAKLQSFLTAPASNRPIHSFDDWLSSELKVLFAPGDYKLLFQEHGPIFAPYKRIFKIVPFPEFEKSRHGLDTSYAYPIGSTAYIIYAEQQKFFARPIFYFDNELCFSAHMVLALALPSNSIYREALNGMILQLRACGIQQHWMVAAFYELVRVGKVSLSDLSSYQRYQALDVVDLYWIWIVLIASQGIAILAFIGELCYFRYKARKY